MKMFGTFKGVFLPSYEAILGAVIFLLLPGLTANFGFLAVAAIILLAHSVTISTAFSINDCTASVGRVGAGGMYALTKASLGTSFGGSIGIQLYLGQAFSIGFYSMGFATSVVAILNNFSWYGDLIAPYGLTLLTQQQLVATLLIVIGTLLALIGTDFTNKVQVAIFITLNAAVLAVFLSPLIGVTYQGQTIFRDSPYWYNVLPPMDYWVGLTIFFPAVTGIDAGVGMSGLLKNPRRSLPLGTFASIFATLLVYLGCSFFYSLIRPELLRFSLGTRDIPTILTYYSGASWIYPILIVGIFSTTSSSTIAYFISAPQTLKALAEDRILPGPLRILGKDFFKGGQEPRFGILLTTLIGILVIWSGNLAFSSRLVGIAFLMIYGWINFAAFLERVSMNPSFRPSRVGHWSINLFGFLISLFLISMDNVLLGAAVLAFQLLIFALLSRYRSGDQLEGVWWGTFFRLMKWSLDRLGTLLQGTKNWRPVVVAFAFDDQPEKAAATFRIGSLITRNQGLLTAHLLQTKSLETTFDLPVQVLAIDLAKESPTQALGLLTQGGLSPSLAYNTVLLPFDTRLDLVTLIERLIEKNRNVLLFKDSGNSHDKRITPRIDIWWRGMANGNLMAIVAYMMTRDRSSPYKSIRILRTLELPQNLEQAREEMLQLLYSARLEGEVCILQPDKRQLPEVIREYSQDAGLIMMGMPGKMAGVLTKLFKLDRMFFSQEIRKYDLLPPILFVRSAGNFSLLDD